MAQSGNETDGDEKAIRIVSSPRFGDLPRLLLADLPTPVFPFPSSNDRSQTGLWIKDDSKTSTLYGGNKVRKLEWLLAQALVKGSTKTWTIGPAGSHHVLATASFSRLVGLEPHALLFPEYETPHSLQIHRAIEQSGCLVTEAHTWASVPSKTLRSLPGAGTYVIPPGASNALGNLGFFLAGLELAEQVRSHQCPKPDVIVVALGSAGTAAGLWMGLDAAGLSCRLDAVRVTSGLVANSINLARQATDLVHLLEALQAPAARTARRPPTRHTTIRVVTDQFGGCYGRPTKSGERALKLAADRGLDLDPVYTGKAFAHAVALHEKLPHRTILFWNTYAGHREEQSR